MKKWWVVGYFLLYVPVLWAAVASGPTHASSFDLPVSRLLSAESRAVLERVGREHEELGKRCPFDVSSAQKVQAFRACYAMHFFSPLVDRFRSRYPVTIEFKSLGGMRTEIITPEQGVSRSHLRSVLINLHGGGFVSGERWGGQVESIPIAAVGGFKVISVDYRMAPDFKFPAASEDVDAVYRELLKSYQPRNIGIYGCSAGGVLTAQVVAWLQHKGLPRPGAVGMFCGAGAYWGEGDSGYFAAAIEGMPSERFNDPRQNPYLMDADPGDPLAFPVRSPQVLAKFPPSLLITSTRDLALSSVSNMQSRLIANGIEAELHVWDGLGHAFFYEPDLPESREVYELVARFFDRHLGR